MCVLVVNALFKDTMTVQAGQIQGSETMVN